MIPSSPWNERLAEGIISRLSETREVDFCSTAIRPSTHHEPHAGMGRNIWIDRSCSADLSRFTLITHTFLTPVGTTERINFGASVSAADGILRASFASIWSRIVAAEGAGFFAISYTLKSTLRHIGKESKLS